MLKVKKYQKIVLNLLNEYAAIKSPFMPDVENRVISDTKHHNYQLIRIGQYKDKHVHYAVFHFEILDGKVWIVENRTDARIEEELIDAGVAPKDIAWGLKKEQENLKLMTA
jgi:XisI protein